MTTPPLTRQQAKAQGLKTYHAAVHCPGDHGTERLVRSGKCPACEQEARAKRSSLTAVIREEEREKARAWALREVKREAAREAKQAEQEARKAARKAAVEAARKEREAAKRAAAREAKRLERAQQKEREALEAVPVSVVSGQGLDAVAPWDDLEGALEAPGSSTMTEAQAPASGYAQNWTDPVDLIQTPGSVVTEGGEDLPPWM